MNILEMNHIKKTFDEKTVLKDISFDVNTGDIIAIVGPSGSGKSTLLRCLNMIETPSSGKIVFEGTNLVDKKTNLSLVREKIGMVFQQRGKKDFTNTPWQSAKHYFIKTSFNKLKKFIQKVR